MARAGFYAIESHQIRFGRDGEWYSDGERIANRRIADLFSRCIQRAPDGSFLLQVGDEKAPIEVEDTPYVVRQIHERDDGSLECELNDGTRETLEPGSLRLLGNGVLYCRVKDGTLTARFLRAAQASLAGRIVAGENATWWLETREGRRPIAVEG